MRVIARSEKKSSKGVTHMDRDVIDWRMRKTFGVLSKGILALTCCSISVPDL